MMELLRNGFHARLSIVQLIFEVNLFVSVIELRKRKINIEFYIAGIKN